MAKKRIPYTFPLKLFRYYVMTCAVINNAQLSQCAENVYKAWVKQLLDYLPPTYAEMTKRAIENYIESLRKSEKDRVEAWKELNYTLAILWDREFRVFGSVEFNPDFNYIT